MWENKTITKFPQALVANQKDLEGRGSELLPTTPAISQLRGYFNYFDN